MANLTIKNVIESKIEFLVHIILDTGPNLELNSIVMNNKIVCSRLKKNSVYFTSTIDVPVGIAFLIEIDLTNFSIQCFFLDNLCEDEVTTL